MEEEFNVKLLRSEVALLVNSLMAINNEWGLDENELELKAKLEKVLRGEMPCR